ncbi:hypothetical protein D3C78_427820 [compost metagenome]
MPSEVGNRLSISSVGPTMNTNTASTSASTMLVLDSHWIPLPMPDTAEVTKAMVSRVMIEM